MKDEHLDSACTLKFLSIASDSSVSIHPKEWGFYDGIWSRRMPGNRLIIIDRSMNIKIRENSSFIAAASNNIAVIHPDALKIICVTDKHGNNRPHQPHRFLLDLLFVR